MTDLSAPPFKSVIGLIIAVAVSSAVAHLCTSALPFQVGALIEGYQFSATQAGLFGFFQVGALALSMILFSPIAHRYRPGPLCLVGMAVAIAANLVIYYSPPSVPLICALGLVAGAAYGLILTAAVAAAAGDPQPDRIYAAGNSGSLLLIVVILSALPMASSSFGSRGTFFAVALVITVSAPLLLGFRARRLVDTGANPSGVTFRAGLPLLAIWSLFSLGTGGMWAFVERVGSGLGLSGPTIGWVLSSSAFTGLIGTALAALVIGRLSRITALAIGLVGGGATCLMFALVSDLWTYAAAAVLYWIFTMFAYVLLLGTAALLDPTGRLGTLGTGCERLAFAVGAPIGGLMVDYGSTRWIGIGAAIVCALVAPLFLPGLRRVLLGSSQASEKRVSPLQVPVP